MSLHLVLVSETPDVRPADLYALVKPARVNAAHCAEVWDKAPPAIDVIDRLGKIPSGAHPIIFVDSSPGKTSTLAYHYWDPLRNGPAARVYPHKSSGMNKGSYSLIESLTHEITEIIADPAVNLWVDMPGDDDEIQVALENADPVQTHYTVTDNGTDWRVANFVTPHWFQRDLAGGARLREFLSAGGRFDYSRELNRAGQIGPQGYAICRLRTDTGWKSYTITASGQAKNFAHDDAKWHGLSRTTIRGIKSWQS